MASLDSVISPVLLRYELTRALTAACIVVELLGVLPGIFILKSFEGAPVTLIAAFALI